jgi:hypothetical protein
VYLHYTCILIHVDIMLNSQREVSCRVSFSLKRLNISREVKAIKEMFLQNVE